MEIKKINFKITDNFKCSTCIFKKNRCQCYFTCSCSHYCFQLFFEVTFSFTHILKKYTKSLFEVVSRVSTHEMHYITIIYYSLLYIYLFNYLFNILISFQVYKSFTIINNIINFAYSKSFIIINVILWYTFVTDIKTFLKIFLKIF